MFYVTLNWDGCRLCQEDWAKIRNAFNLLDPGLFFLILAHPVYKM